MSSFFQIYNTHLVFFFVFFAIGIGGEYPKVDLTIVGDNFF
jgi:hypothetical protein